MKEGDDDVFPTICHLSCETQKFLTRFCHNNDWKHSSQPFRLKLETFERKFIWKILICFQKT